MRKSIPFSRFCIATLPMLLVASPSRLVAAPTTDTAGQVWLDSLDLSQASQDYGDPHANQTVDGHPLTLHSTVYNHGFGTHAAGRYRVDLHQNVKAFTAVVGVDDEAQPVGSVTFEVWVDGKPAVQTKVLHRGDTPVELSVPTVGAKTLELRVTDGGDGNTWDHADWANAQFVLANAEGPKPTSVSSRVDPNVPPRLVMPAPNIHTAIHGPRVVGASPKKPFLFLIPTTGEGPITFSARNLPAGLTLDSKSGIIRGALAKSGRFVTHVTATGPEGVAARDLVILSGPNMLARTPPMGWNSWNVWANAVDADKVKAAADSLVSTGLAGHGFQYVNIDDTWEAGRSSTGEIESNAKFPNMPDLADYVHAAGLKVGLYSSPGPTTCANFTASYGHEAQDAQTYAKWGFDYLKYDWCSYDSVVHGDHSLPALKAPYAKMGQDFKSSNRDIVYSLCQYGMGDVWKWGGDVGGNTWRTTGDIQDTWGSLHGILESQDGHEKYAGPGHWNDPDMLIVGILGWGSPHPTHLAPNEQILHITMWSMLSSPLLIGCDLTRLDPFTLALLTNDDVLDIDQDPMAKPAGKVAHTDETEIWARPLADGTTAVSLLNTGLEPGPVTVNWSAIGIHGHQPMRDLWMHMDLGKTHATDTITVPAHGAVLLKVGTPAAGWEGRIGR